MTFQKLSHQRKKQLKLVMIEKAKERLQEEAATKRELKKQVLSERISDLPNLNNIGKRYIIMFFFMSLIMLIHKIMHNVASKDLDSMVTSLSLI